MSQNCSNCGNTFEVTQADLNFYDKVSPEFGGKKYAIPAPTHCPDCRQQRRAARRNERNFYHRKCDKTGKQIITMYRPDADLKVYDTKEWWSDDWDPLEYGRDFEPSRSFFQQFAELQSAVPRAALFGKNNENCDYTNHTENSKNCYICADTVAEDTYYSKWMIDCKDCCDCYQMMQSELCYQSMYADHNHHCAYIISCDSCSDSAFLFDCNGCRDCFMCWNLRHKQYCIQNEQLTKEEYEKRMQDVHLDSYEQLQPLHQHFAELKQKHAIHQDQRVDGCEDCTGNYIYHSARVYNSYDIIESQDCAYCYDAGQMKDCQDVYESMFDCELQFNTHGCNRGKRLISCSVCYDVDNCFYSDACHNSHDLFGCIGLRRKEYCILNKQYTQDAYMALAAKIVEQMQNDGEWGQFFPVELSPFTYNESVAQEYYPLSKSDVELRKWSWYTDESTSNYMGPQVQIPDRVGDVSDDICDQVCVCSKTDQLYKIAKQELDFYRKMQVALPRICPDARHSDRMRSMNPRTLWNRQCAKCSTDIQTTYAPDRPEKILCESCYLNEIQ